MILSMTGYGRAEKQLHGRILTLELRSVNARYFEYSSRMPRAFVRFDDMLKKTVNSRVTRGKLELSLQCRDVEGQDQRITADTALARGYLQAIHTLSQELSLPDDTIGLRDLLRFPDILSAAPVQPDEQQLAADLQEVLEQALTRFVAMRAAEGDKLQEDILSRLDFLEEAVGQVEQDSAQRLEKYTARLYERLKVLLEDRTVDDARVLTEAAIFADKTAVDEETVRLRSHIRQYREILQTGGPVGRKLDFLTQELNRETNTIGSKCQDIAITRLVVDMKAEIEKIREQIQNLE